MSSRPQTTSVGERTRPTRATTGRVSRMPCITVNALCPGYVETDIIAHMKPEERAGLVARIPAQQAFVARQGRARGAGLVAGPLPLDDREAGLHVLADAVHDAVQQRDEQRVLGSEVAIERPDGVAELLGEALDRETLVPLGLEQVKSGVDDPLDGGFSALLSHRAVLVTEGRDRESAAKPRRS